MHLIGSKSVATVLTWLVLLLFIVIVGLGWWFLVESISGNAWIAAAAATLITALAVLFSRQVGHYRAAAHERGEKPALHHGWKPYLFLAVLSALGTLNAAFILLESKDILRNDIADVRQRYVALRDAAAQQFTPPGHAEKEERVKNRLAALRREIDNPNGGNYCGVGPEARRIIAEIRTDLPGYRELNGSGIIRPCDHERATAVYTAYEGLALQMVARDPEAVGPGNVPRLEFRDGVQARYAQHSKAMADLEEKASGFGGTEFISKKPLSDARDAFNGDRQTLETLGGTPPADAQRITSLQTEEVNSWGSTLSLFLRRLGKLTTWFYLIIALGLDFVLIYLITQLNIRYREDQLRIAVVDPRFETDPRFLWSSRR